MSLISLVYFFQILWAFFLVSSGLTCSILVLVTSVIWIPLVLLVGAQLCLISFLLNFTRVGEVLVKYLLCVSKKILSKQNFRYATFEILHLLSSVACIDILENITSLNFGYAWMSESGDVPKSCIRMPDTNNVRQYQLYDYCITNMTGFNNVMDELSVLDLCCGAGGGIKFLAQNYQVTSAIGVEVSSYLAGRAQALL